MDYLIRFATVYVQTVFIGLVMMAVSGVAVTAIQFVMDAVMCIR